MGCIRPVDYISDALGFAAAASQANKNQFKTLARQLCVGIITKLEVRPEQGLLSCPLQAKPRSDAKQQMPPTHLLGAR